MPTRLTHEPGSHFEGGFCPANEPRISAREGLRHVWIVDPTSHTIEVFRAEAEGWLVVRAVLDEAEAALEPFDAVDRRGRAGPGRR